MDEEIKSDFLVALRSGDYIKTVGALAEEVFVRNNKGGKTRTKCYCAQGVLADLAVKAGIVNERVCTVGGLDAFYSFNGRASFLPDVVLEWSGLTREQAMTIQRMNDHENKSLEKIADWVEENV